MLDHVAYRASILHEDAHSRCVHITNLQFSVYCQCLCVSSVSCLTIQDAAQDQSRGYPTVNASIMLYGTLAASHLNIVLRCFEQGLTSPITGKKFSMTGMNANLCTSRHV